MNKPIKRKEMEELKKGFYPTPFANRKMRRTRADKFTQLKKAVEKRKEAYEAMRSPKSFGLPTEFKVYWFFRNRVNRLAKMCYPKRATI